MCECGFGKRHIKRPSTTFGVWFRRTGEDNGGLNTISGLLTSQTNHSFAGQAIARNNVGRRARNICIDCDPLIAYYSLFSAAARDCFWRPVFRGVLGGWTPKRPACDPHCEEAAGNGCAYREVVRTPVNVARSSSTSGGPQFRRRISSSRVAIVSRSQRKKLHHVYRKTQLAPAGHL